MARHIYFSLPNMYYLKRAFNLIMDGYNYLF